MTPPRQTLLAVLWIDALGNVLVKPSRSALAVLGIAAGTASVIALLHVGLMAREEALRSFADLGSDTIVVQAPAGGRDRARIRPQDASGMPLGRLGLRDEAPLIRGSALVFEGREQISADVVGTTDQAAAILRLPLIHGRMPSALDGMEPFAVVGAAIAERLRDIRGSAVAIGDRIHVGQETFRIIGVLASHPMNPLVGIQPDRSLLTNLKAASRLVDDPSISSIAARMREGEAAPDVGMGVAAYFREILGGVDVQVQLASELIAGAAQQTRIYDSLLLAIGVIALSIGGIGIMNVMLMSVMERKEEIGLRMAIGASPGAITFMFLSESMILASAGAAFGLAAGIAAAWIMATRSGWTFAFVPASVPLGICMALFVGIFFGIYPARRAASLNPVAALRKD